MPLLCGEKRCRGMRRAWEHTPLKDSYLYIPTDLRFQKTFLYSLPSCLLRQINKSARGVCSTLWASPWLCTASYSHSYLIWHSPTQNIISSTYARWSAPFENQIEAKLSRLLCRRSSWVCVYIYVLVSDQHDEVDRGKQGVRSDAPGFWWVIGGWWVLKTLRAATNQWGRRADRYPIVHCHWMRSTFAKELYLDRCFRLDAATPPDYYPIAVSPSGSRVECSNSIDRVVRKAQRDGFRIFSDRYDPWAVPSSFNGNTVISNRSMHCWACI